MKPRGYLALVLLVGLAGCKSSQGQSGTAGQSDVPAPRTPGISSSTTPSQEISMPSGLKYQDIVVGQGQAAASGRRVQVNYTGWLTDGTQFDSSVGRAPFEFTLGAQEVIRGWDDGVTGMKEGGKRKLTIPPDLGYGARGAGGVIPPNATLLFEVELLKVY